MLSFFYFQRHHIRPRRNSFQQLAKIAVDSFNKNGLNYPQHGLFNEYFVFYRQDNPFSHPTSETAERGRTNLLTGL